MQVQAVAGAGGRGHPGNPGSRQALAGERGISMRSMRRVIGTIACSLLVALLMTPLAGADYGDGSIIGWGQQVVGGDMSADFVSVAGGSYHSLGLKSDGSIVAWGYDGWWGQCDVPAP
ncbi:MAG: hypothetical protein KAY37_08285, partial [Phycisphaerae bacterium]|nr:hypothetical protein [Phycisphaerae bacterium]